jgi:hypothetical protein
MGKAQKKRSMRRHNPVRVPDSHLPKGLASASSSSSKTDAILPIIQKVVPSSLIYKEFNEIIAEARWKVLIQLIENGLA